MNRQVTGLLEPGRTFITGVWAVLGAVQLFPVFSELFAGLEGLVAVLAEGFRDVVLFEVRFELARVDEGLRTFWTLVTFFQRVNAGDVLLTVSGRGEGPVAVRTTIAGVGLGEVAFSVKDQVAHMAALFVTNIAHVRVHPDVELPVPVERRLVLEHPQAVATEEGSLVNLSEMLGQLRDCPECLNAALTARVNPLFLVPIVLILAVLQQQMTEQVSFHGESEQANSTLVAQLACHIIPAIILRPFVSFLPSNRRLRHSIT